VALDIRTAQDDLEDLLRDTILYALGKRLPAASTLTVAALRAFPTMGASSSAMPADVTGVGRWLAWTTPLRFSTNVGADSVTLDQIQSGPLQRVVVLDKKFSDEEMADLIQGAVPAVFIVASSDMPEDMTQDTGSIFDDSYEFEVMVVVENLRDRREAAHGSPLDGDTGANKFDGFIQALLCGTQLTAVQNGVRNVQVGRAENFSSDLAERRVIRSRQYVVQATKYFPNAPNEVNPAQEVDFSPHLAALNDAREVADLQYYVVDGLRVGTVAGVYEGLTQAVFAGSAVIAGSGVAYPGEVRTLTAWTDTYRDLKPDGTMVFIEVPAGGEAPDPTVGALRVGVTSTNGVGVVWDVILAETVTDADHTYTVPLD
jgi:hypothetical protein